ncbi:MAG: hypothetical protein RLZZ245_1064 [Verrucomicrobiota bacterium]
MAKSYKVTVDRIKSFRDAWRNLAPADMFAGMTYTEFEVATEPALTLRDEILVLEQALFHKKTEKLIVEASANELLDFVVNSVRGTRRFGHDSILYRAFGYIRKSQQKSGLTRKATKSAEKSAVDAKLA